MSPWYLPELRETELETLPAGLLVYRLHPADRPWDQPNNRKPRLRIGGRFDGLRGDPPTWYASTSCRGALTESLFRFGGHGEAAPVVALGAVAGLRMTVAALQAPIDVVRLTGPAFQALRIAPSVVGTLDQTQYAVSRQAADDLLDAADARPSGTAPVAGITWMCARNPHLTSLVLWERVDVGGVLADRLDFRSSHSVSDDRDLIEELADLYGYQLVS